MLGYQIPLNSMSATLLTALEDIALLLFVSFRVSKRAVLRLHMQDCDPV